MGFKNYKNGAKTGEYRPLHPEKCRSKLIIYRSSWELRMMLWLDNHPNVIWWESEEKPIPYKSPIDKRYHRYFIDFKICIKDKNNNKKIYLIEIKPKSQTLPPKKPQKITESYIKKVKTYGVNEAKWKAAKEYCQKHNYEFKIFTEIELGIKK